MGGCQTKSIYSDHSIQLLQPIKKSQNLAFVALVKKTTALDSLNLILSCRLRTCYTYNAVMVTLKGFHLYFSM